MHSEEKKLWELYKKTGSRQLQEKLVTEYLDIVSILANKLLIFTSSGMTKDDLYSAGVMGLLEAIERFDHNSGYEFRTFASKRVRGSMIDEIRRVDWVPRSVRQKSRNLDKAIHILYNKLERMPSDIEIAEQMELSVEDYYKMTDKLGPMFISSLDERIGGAGGEDNLHYEDVIEDKHENSFESRLLKEKLRKNIIQAIKELPQREKLVVSLYYYEELTLKEIGKILEVSESRICQIHSSAIFKLKSSMKDMLPRDNNEFYS